MWRARCSLREKTMRHSPYPRHWNVFAGAGLYRLERGIGPGMLGTALDATMVAISSRARRS